MRSLLPAHAWLVGAGLFVGVPAGMLLALFLTEERLDDIGRPPTPLVEPPRTVEFDDRTGVVATLRWSQGPMLYAPAWSGVVGEVRLRPGNVVRNGDAVATIDGVTRLAVRTPQPFFRALSIGDRGPDVGWLHEALVALGHLDRAPADEQQVGPETLLAVRSLAAQLGVVTAVHGFDPAWVVWLPSESLEVASVMLVAGSPAPAAGTPVAAGAPQLASVELTRVEGGPLALDPGERYVLELGGVDVPLGGMPPSVGADGLTRLSGVLPPSAETTSGSVRLAEPIRLWALPASAVMAGPDGRLCIWVVEGTGYAPLAVEVMSARAGVSFVRPTAAPGNILQNPSEVLDEPACPSG